MVLWVLRGMEFLFDYNQLHIHKKVQWPSESLKWEENNSISPRSQFLYDLFHLWYEHLPIKENKLILVSCHLSWHQIEQVTCHMKSYCNSPCVEIWFFSVELNWLCNLMVTSQLAPTHNVRTYLQHLWSLSGSPKFFKNSMICMSHNCMK